MYNPKVSFSTRVVRHQRGRKGYRHRHQSFCICLYSRSLLKASLKEEGLSW